MSHEFSLPYDLVMVLTWTSTQAAAAGVGADVGAFVGAGVGAGVGADVGATGADAPPMLKVADSAEPLVNDVLPASDSPAAGMSM